MKKELVTRYEGNPILTKEDIPCRVQTVQNAGLAKFDGRYIMLFRSHLETLPNLFSVSWDVHSPRLLPNGQAH